MTYTIVLEQGDAGWGALAPDLPGLMLLGETRDEVLAEAPGAIADYLDALRDAGQPLPQPGEWAVPIDVPAA